MMPTGSAVRKGPAGKGTAGAKVKTQETGDTLGKELSLGP